MVKLSKSLALTTVAGLLVLVGPAIADDHGEAVSEEAVQVESSVEETAQDQGEAMKEEMVVETTEEEGETAGE